MEETVMPISQQELGRRLRVAREACRMTQEAVARRLGVSRSTVAQMELGNRAVTSLELDRLAGLLVEKPETALFGAFFGAFLVAFFFGAFFLAIRGEVIFAAFFFVVIFAAFFFAISFSLLSENYQPQYPVVGFELCTIEIIIQYLVSI